MGTESICFHSYVNYRSHSTDTCPGPGGAEFPGLHFGCLRELDMEQELNILCKWIHRQWPVLGRAFRKEADGRSDNSLILQSQKVLQISSKFG